MQQLKNIEITTIKEQIKKGMPEKEILKICDKLYEMLNFLSVDYPKNKSWFYTKHLPGTLNEKSGRDIIFAYDKENNIYGTAFIKYQEEKKICTLYVAPNIRSQGIGSTLIEKSMQIMETTKPMITFPEKKLPMFKGIIKKYNWELTQILEGVYRPKTKELVYNGYLEK